MNQLSPGERSSAHNNRKQSFSEFKQRFFSISGYISFTLAALFALYLIFSKNDFWPHAFLMVLPASLPVVRQPVFAEGKTKAFFGYLMLMLFFIGMVILTVPIMGLASLMTFGGVLAGSWILTAALLIAEKSHEMGKARSHAVSIYHISEEEIDVDDEYWDDDLYSEDAHLKE